MTASSLRHVPVLLACSVSWAVAAGVGTETQERARISSERAAAQSAFVSRERDCLNRFVVTSCVETARRDLREVLLRLRRQEALLDEMQRRDRAAQRLESIRNRPVAAEPTPRHAAASEPQAKKTDTPRVRAHAAPAPKLSAQERQTAEGLSEQKFEAASQAASARRAAVEKRNAERAASGKKAAPLPLPAGASAP
jgi:hypothetical protein